MAKRELTSKNPGTPGNPSADLVRSEAPSELLRELVAHLRQNRTQLRKNGSCAFPKRACLPP